MGNLPRYRLRMSEHARRMHRNPPSPHSWAGELLALKPGESRLFELTKPMCSRFEPTFRRLFQYDGRRHSSYLEHCLITGAVRGVRVTRIR